MKAVNDTYGHIVGDEVLVTVASALAGQGVTVGRYGGDEFLVLIGDADRRVAEQYCRAVLHKLRRSAVNDRETGSLIPTMASLGLTVYPVEADSIEGAIRLADSAMYTEKRERANSGDARLVHSALADERAAKMIGEIVPLLTSPGNLQDKLRLVAHRLSLGAGYDIVRLNLTTAQLGVTATSSSSQLPKDTLRAWDETRGDEDTGPMARRLREIRRPIIVDDVLTSAEYSQSEKELLRQANVRSVLLVPMLWQNEFLGVLSVAARTQGALDARDARFLAAVADQLTAIIRMESLVEDLESAAKHLQDARGDTVVLLAAAAEAHDDNTGQHLKRVQITSELLAIELGYGEAEAKALGLAAVLHDIGTIRVPESILLSPARLNGDEWELMRQHTVWGADFLAERPGFEIAAQIALAHHERWDGSGYPRGLTGDAIPEFAAVVSVADSLDAMTNDRPYRAARPLGWAVEEIARCSGTQFSPRVVKALASLFAKGALSLAEKPSDEAAAA
jgi:diguanylate cyclase (GGDEF)-like protein